MPDISPHSLISPLPEQPKPKRRAKRLLFAAVILGLLAGAAYGISAIQQSFLDEITVKTSLEPIEVPSASSGVFIKRAAPDITLKDLHNKTVRLREFRGRPVLILFFASWNEMSLDALRVLNAKSRDLAEAGVAVFAIDNLETSDAAQTLQRRMELDLSILVDAEGVAGELFRAATLPAFFFIDADGIVKAHAVGMLSADDILVKAL